ncbi:hypothetical protein DQ04_14871020, partial [Trypanosoma grayi]|uniref:hypothetical protein n=1 Tax=Trypanosoma grayi TaxID=71804 RepID=UPI0004F422BB
TRATAAARCCCCCCSPRPHRSPRRCGLDADGPCASSLRTCGRHAATRTPRSAVSVCTRVSKTSSSNCSDSEASDMFLFSFLPGFSFFSFVAFLAAVCFSFS